jgi:MFS family permease
MKRPRKPGRVAGTPLLIVLAMAQFMVVLDFTIVNVALPSIQTGLHIGTSTLQWLISGYAVTFGGFLLLGGRLADLFGQARMFRIGLIVFVVASVAGGLAVEPILLITSRVVQGIGAAIVAPAGLSLLVTSWPEERARSHALGIYGAVVSTGFASGRCWAACWSSRAGGWYSSSTRRSGCSCWPATGCCPSQRRPARADWTCPARSPAPRAWR